MNLSATSERCTPAASSLPAGRGPLSHWTIERLRGLSAAPPPLVPPDAGLGADAQLALYLIYELNYSTPPPSVVDEYDPLLVALRADLEAAFEAALVPLTERPGALDGDVGDMIVELIAHDSSPSTGEHLLHHGTTDQLREYLKCRSAYQLKEADPQSFAIPHVGGRAKQLLVEIQSGEYGADEPGRTMHSDLFAEAMRELGLDDSPNAYLDELPASALAISNLVSMFGLNRRWRAALLGHLAVTEMTSVPAMHRLLRVLDRLGVSDRAQRFFAVHTLADAEHEVLALDMVRHLAADHPDEAGDIVLGAHCAIAVEGILARDLIRRWRGRA